MFQSSYLAPWSLITLSYLSNKLKVKNPTKEGGNFPFLFTNVSLDAQSYENTSFQGSELGHRDTTYEPFGM